MHESYCVWFMKLVRFRQKSCWNTFNDVSWHIAILCVGIPSLTLPRRRLFLCNVRLCRPKVRWTLSELWLSSFRRQLTSEIYIGQIGSNFNSLVMERMIRSLSLSVSVSFAIRCNCHERITSIKWGFYCMHFVLCLCVMILFGMGTVMVQCVKGIRSQKH
jgi:hypothetical protein